MRSRAALRSVARCFYAAVRREIFSKSATLDAVVFAGDSITEQWAGLETAFAPLKAVNRGISGDSSAGLLSRFEKDILACRPRAVVILIGTNDLSAGIAPRRIAAAIRRMTGKAVSGGWPVILCLVTPRTKAPGAFVTEIQELNSLIRKLGNKRKNVLACDTFTPLADSAGSCRQGSFTDGLHLSVDGYERLTAALKPILNRLPTA